MLQMDTALHIAVRKSSASVEGRIRSRSQVSPDIFIIQNKVLYFLINTDPTSHSCIFLDGTRSRCS